MTTIMPSHKDTNIRVPLDERKFAWAPTTNKNHAAKVSQSRWLVITTVWQHLALTTVAGTLTDWHMLLIWWRAAKQLTAAFAPWVYIARSASKWIPRSQTHELAPQNGWCWCCTTKWWHVSSWCCCQVHLRAVCFQPFSGKIISWVQSLQPNLQLSLADVGCCKAPFLLTGYTVALVGPEAI